MRSAGAETAPHGFQRHRRRSRVARRVPRVARGERAEGQGPGARARHGDRRRRLPRTRQALAGDEVRRGARAHHVGARVRRPQRHVGAADHLRSGRGALRRPERGVHHRARHDRADAARGRHPRATAALSHEAAARRGDLVAALQRTRSRLRRRIPRDHGDARRRRVADQRSEGVDLGRAVLRLRRDRVPHQPRRREAQGHHRVHRRHEGARGSRSSRSSR